MGAAHVAGAGAMLVKVVAGLPLFLRRYTTPGFIVKLFPSFFSLSFLCSLVVLASFASVDELRDKLRMCWA